MYIGCKQFSSKTICTNRLSAEKKSASAGGDEVLFGTELSMWNTLKSENI